MIENFNLDDLFPPVVTMADQRTMAQLLQAPVEGYEDAIVIPAITADNFELKHGLLTLVQNKQFFGHDKEDPHAHICYFNKITSTLKFPNVPNTSIKLMLFPFSLEGATQIWLEKEPPRSIFTWNDLVSKFINQFFPPSKTTNLLNEITNFQQRFDESFSIIESKSKVRYSRNKPIVAKVSTTTSTSGVSPDVAELKDMVGTLLLDKKGQNQSPAPVKVVEESCVTCGGSHSYRNCPATDGNVYRDNIQEFVSQASAVNLNQGNTSYRPPMMSNQIQHPGFPPVPNNQNLQRNNQNRFIPNQNRDNNFNQGHVYQPLVFQPPAYQVPAYQALAPQTQGVSKEDFLAYVKANDAMMRNMQTQGQNMHNQLTNLTDLITKFVNSNTASTLSSGTLPSNTIANLKSEPKVTNDTLNPTNNGNTEDVQPQAVQSESRILIFKPVTSPISEPAIAPKKLSLPDLTPTCMTLELVDRSISRPVRVVEDVYVKVGSFHFLAEFVVVDFDADPRVPLILRRSFLKTERALIDVFEGELTLRFCKEAVTFNLDQTSRYSANYSDMTAKRIDVIDMACEEYSQEMLERLAGNQYYYFLDGFFGYFQIPIDPKDQEKTTFTCPYETFAYRRMPFGLCNAPGTFQRNSFQSCLPFRKDA
nr:reverse transcriptase domain-containing protein [Tanacetum cinerariifolium]